MKTSLVRRALHLALAVGLSVTPQGLGFWPPASSLEPRTDVAWAAVPWMINYQGRLTDTGGNAITGAYAMTFRLYDESSAGAEVWEEEQEITLVEADNGIFSVVLGGVTPLSTVDFNIPLWLSVQVADDEEMTPRQRLTATGYAMNSDTVDALDSSQLMRTDVSTATSGTLTITRSGLALLVQPTVDPAADTKLVDVQNAAGASLFSVDIEGDAASTGNLVVTGDLNVTGTITGSTTISGTTNPSWNVGSTTDASSSNLSLLMGQAAGQESLVYQGASTGDFSFSDDVRLGTQSALRLEDDAGGDYVGLKAPAGVTSYTLTLPAVVGAADRILKTVDANGTLGWVADDNAGGTVTQIDQGTGLSFSSNPLTTTGTISLDAAADLTYDGVWTLNGNWVNTANPWADNEVANDITLTNLTQITTRSFADLQATCADGEVVGGNAAGTGLECQADTDSGGTVTSVGLSMPAEFSVANSPVTGSGILTVTEANQSANTIYSGPASGAAASPGFRVLGDDDIPDTLTVSAGSVEGSIVGSGIDADNITAGTLNAARLPNDGYASTYVNVTGDTMSGSLTMSNVASDLVTGANEHLALMPNGTGNVGIGTTAPLAKLDVAGSARVTGTATSVLTGSIDPAAATAVAGVGTAFATELVVGDRITVSGETRTVTAIADDTNLTVDTAFSDNANDASPDKLAAELLVRDSSGNLDAVINDAGSLGLGTSAPDEQLHMTGRMHLAATTAPADTTAKLYNVAGALYWDGIELSVATSNPSFASLSSGENVNAGMTVGTGASLVPNGTGLIRATDLTAPSSVVADAEVDDNLTIGDTGSVHWDALTNLPANLDLDSTNDLTTATTFVGDVGGAYNDLQLGAGVVGTSELADGAVLRAKLNELRPHAQTVADNTVRVEAGTTILNGTKVTIAAGDSPMFQMVAVNPRIDLLVLENDGDLAIVSGVEAASPTAPTYPDDRLVLAEVYVDESGMLPTINAGEITDVRPFLNLTTDTDTTNVYTADGQGIELVGSDFRLELDGTTLSRSATGLKVNAVTDTEVADDITLDWAGLQNYPAGCAAGEYVRVVGDTLTCVADDDQPDDDTEVPNDLTLTSTKAASIIPSTDVVPLTMRRGTDAAPTANLLTIRDAANGADLFAVDAAGSLSAGTVPWARISGFNGDTTPDTIADDGTIDLATEITGDLPLANLTDGGTATHALFATATGTPAYRAVADTDIPDTITMDWAGLQNYPSACGAGEVIQAVGDTLTCVAVNTDTSITLQDAYNAVSGNTITTTDNRDVLISLADTATDSDFLVNLLGTGSIFQVQDGGAPALTVEDGGNVGIGTADPDAFLDIQDPAGSFTADVRLASFKYFGGRSLDILGPAANDPGSPFTFWTDNALSLSVDGRGLLIDEDGNVGIGTSAPTALLHEKGTLSSALTGTVDVTTGTPDVVGSGTFFDTELAEGDAIKIGGEVFTVSEINDATHLTLDSNHAAGASGATAYGDPALLAIDTGDAVNMLTVTRSGDVGIGTTDPDGPLHVVDYDEVILEKVDDQNDGLNSGVRLRHTVENATTPLSGFGTYLGFTLEGFTNGELVDTALIGAMWEGNQTNDTTDRDSALVFRTMLDDADLDASSERMRITSAGNVGLGGITDPDEQLEMTGRLHLGQTTAPVTTTDKLYNVAGALYWNGTDLTAATANPSFASLSSGQNLSAGMVVGTGASLSTAGTGTIQATALVGSGSTTDAVDLATAEAAGILPLSKLTDDATTTFALFAGGAGGDPAYRAIADGDLPDTLTASNYVLKAGDTMTGPLAFDATGGGETDPTISASASGDMTLAAPTGTVVVGSGSGNISLSLSTPADILLADKTTALAAAYTANDFTITRTLTSNDPAETQGGAVLKVTDASDATGTTMNPDMVLVDADPAAGTFTGNLLRLQTGSADMFVVNSAGSLTAGTVPWARISGFNGDTTPDTIADDDTITLGSETTGAYDNTADTIADDGTIDLATEITGDLPLANLTDGGTATHALFATATGTPAYRAVADTDIPDTITMDWTGLQNYPSACGAGQVIQAVGDTLTCVAVNTDTSITLQDAYNAVSGNTITTTDNRNVVISLADTATDSDFLVNLLGTGNIFQIQDTGTPLLTVQDRPAANGSGDIIVVAPVLNDMDQAGDLVTVMKINPDHSGVVTNGRVYGLELNGGNPNATLGSTGIVVDSTWDTAANFSSNVVLSGIANLGIAVPSPSAKLDIDNVDVGNGTSTESMYLRSNAQNITLVDGTTRVNQRQNQFFAPTMIGVAGGNPEAVTNAATLYVDNAPIAGADITISNAYALWVDSGLTRLDDAVQLAQISAPASTTDKLYNVAGALYWNGTDLTAATANPSFASLSSGQNLSAGMVVGTGASLATAGTGTIQATNLVATGSVVADAEVDDNLTVDWAGLQNYPVACGAGEVVQTVGDTLGCVAVNTDASITLQDAYDAVSGNTITTTDNRNVVMSLADTATDSDFLVNLLGTGNVFEVQDSGQAVLTVSEFGNTVFRNTSDNATAFQILDADAGTPIMLVNSVYERVGIGIDLPVTTLDVGGSARVKGSATSVLTGSIDPDGDTSVAGVGTFFARELAAGDRITVSGETRTVVAVANDTGLTVDTAFSDNAADPAPDKLAAQFIVKDASDNVDLIVQDTGNVGIGALAPVAPLHLYASSSVVTGADQYGLVNQMNYDVADAAGNKYGGITVAYANQSAASGTLASLLGSAVEAVKSGTGPVTSAVGLHARIQNLDATGAVTNGYGVFIADSIETGTITNDWGLYQVDGAAWNYFAGNLGIGSITQPDESLHTSGRLHLEQTSAPVTTTDKLYNVGGNLIWNGAQVATGAVGDSLQVNGTNVTTIGNLVNTAASGTMPSVTWLLTAGSPDTISLSALGAASATEAGVVTTGIQTIAGNKTFTGQDIFQTGTDAVTGLQVLDADGGVPVLNIDTVNERVGIGTAAPAEALEVTGNMRLSASGGSSRTIAISTPTGTGAAGTTLNLLAGDHEGSAQNGGGDVIINGGVGFPAGDIVLANLRGNVGINNATPRTMLDVVGSARVKGSAASVLTGSIDPTASTAVVGVGTAFLTELVPGDRITVTGQTRTVSAITDNTNLTVSAAFTDVANDTSVDKLPGEFLVTDNAGNVDLAVHSDGSFSTEAHFGASGANEYGAFNLAWAELADTAAKFASTSAAVAFHSSGTLGGLTGASATATKLNVGAVTTAVGLSASVNNLNATGAITDGYALYLADSVETGAITNDWGLYQVDAGAQNYFAGNVGIGATPGTIPQLYTKSQAGADGVISIDTVDLNSATSDAWLVFREAGAADRWTIGNVGTTDNFIIHDADAGVTRFMVDNSGNAVITGQGDLRLEDDTGGQYVALQAAAGTTSHTLTLPVNNGAGALTNDGNGGLSWTAAGANDTLQTAYDNSSSPATITTASAKNIVFSLADTATDADFLVNLLGPASDITVTSSLANGARAADVMTISQANDATNNSTQSLLELSQLDTQSVAPALNIVQAAGSSGIAIQNTSTTGYGMYIETAGTASNRYGLKISTNGGSVDVFEVKSNGVVAVGNGTEDNLSVLDVSYNTTGATADNSKLIRASNAGVTYDTTGGVLTEYGGHFSNVATRSAGSNALTNVGLYATASGAQNNYAAIFDQGNVGIGMTSPGAKLQVGGSAVILGDRLVDADGSTTYGVGTPDAIAEDAALVAVEAADALCTDSLTAPTSLRIDGNANCNTSGGPPDQGLLGASTGTVAVTGAWAFLDTVAVNGAYDNGEDLYIDNAPATVYRSGNVGIGTATPGYNLDVNGTTNIGGALTYTSTGQPKRTIVLTAAGAIAGPNSTFADQVRTDGTNFSYYTLNYDAGSDEKAFWQFVVPDAYTGATVDVTLYWMYSGGNCSAGSCEVVWDVEMDGKAATATFDAALQTAATDIATGGNTGVLNATAALTPTTGWAPGEVAIVKVTRNADDASDDLGVDAKLVQVKIEWTAAAESD